jgi:hypothetical protein
MVFIYVIQLEEGKYYIGKTNNPQFRLESHFNSNGSEWTKIYKPIRVVELKPNCDDYDEDKITRQYMDKYGINNVRGGSFVSVNLNKSTIDVLTQMSSGTNNNCFVCKKAGHFAKDCQLKMNKNTNFVIIPSKNNNSNKKNTASTEKMYFVQDYEENDFWEDDEYQYKSLKNNKNNYCCFRCGRQGHNATLCYASKHIKGYYLK